MHGPAGDVLCIRKSRRRESEQTEQEFHHDQAKRSGDIKSSATGDFSPAMMILGCSFTKSLIASLSLGIYGI
jgi:hypothetical protein